MVVLIPRWQIHMWESTLGELGSSLWQITVDYVNHKDQLAKLGRLVLITQAEQILYKSRCMQQYSLD